MSSDKPRFTDTPAGLLSRRALMGCGVGLGAFALTELSGLGPALGNGAAPVKPRSQRCRKQQDWGRSSQHHL